MHFEKRQFSIQRPRLSMLLGMIPMSKAYRSSRRIADLLPHFVNRQLIAIDGLVLPASALRASLSRHSASLLLDPKSCSALVYSCRCFCAVLTRWGR